MKYRFFAVMAAILLMTACSLNNPADLMVLDAKIVDMETGDIHENKTIEIRDDSITRIHENEIDFSARDTIRANGKYVIPGLWDMHVHFRGGQELIDENKDLLEIFVAHGVTTVRDAGGDITSAILDWKKEIEIGETTGPRIFTSGPKLDGSDATWDGSMELESTDEIPAAFDSLESLGVDYVKLYDSTIPADVYLAAIEEAEKRELPVTGHMPFTVDFNEAADAGLDATEHMYYVLKGASAEEEEITEAVQNEEYSFWPALTEVIETYDEQVAQDTYAQMAEERTAVVPTLHIGRVLAYLNEEDHSEDAFLNHIGPGIQETYEGRLEAAQNQSEEATERRRNLEQIFTDMIPDLHEADVPILAGSDSGPYNSFVYPGISLHEELEDLVEAGLSPLEALQTSVRNGPAFFDLSDRYGKVESNYAADLVILNSNPLDEIENTQDIHVVIARGELSMQKPARQSIIQTPSDEESNEN